MLVHDRTVQRREGGTIFCKHAPGQQLQDKVDHNALLKQARSKAPLGGLMYGACPAAPRRSVQVHQS